MWRKNAHFGGKKKELTTSIVLLIENTGVACSYL
jgi:hypothetical protein